MIARVQALGAQTKASGNYLVVRSAPRTEPTHGAPEQLQPVEALRPALRIHHGLPDHCSGVPHAPVLLVPLGPRGPRPEPNQPATRPQREAYGRLPHITGKSRF